MFTWLNWKYNREYLLDPKYYMWIFLIVGSFLMIFGGVGLFTQNQSKSKCTAVTYGVVAKVELEKQSAFRDIYSATVEPVDPTIFSGSKTITGETDEAFEKGKYVEIHYDPSDASHFYIENESPSERNLALVIAGGTMTLIGITIFGFYKAYLKRNAAMQ